MSEPSLTEFLRARLAEDEAIAEAGLDYLAGGTVAALPEPMRPERLLLEVEAKRRIVETLVLPYIAERRRLMNGQPSWGDEHPDLLLLLALPYADHDDYDESWRP